MNMMDDFNLGGEMDFDDDLFIDAIDEIDGDDLAYQFARIRRPKPPRRLSYEDARKAARAIGKLEPGDYVDMIVSGSFIAGDFLEAYLFQNDLVAVEMCISTLSLSRENVDSLKTIMDFRLTGNLGLIVSDYFFVNERTSGVKDIIKTLGENGGFYFAAARIHTKITTMRTQCGMNLVFSGSANLRSSANIEQITITNDKVLCDFHRGWMGKIINEYRVSHKLLQRAKLWQLVQKRGDL